MYTRDKAKKNQIENRIRGTFLTFLVLMILSFSACKPSDMGGDMGQESVSENNEPKTKETGFIAADPDSYDSADTCLVVDKNQTDKTVTFLNFQVKRQYTLSYDGTTRLYNRFGETISLEQIKRGDVVDILFLKRKKHLTDMRISSNAWKVEDVDNYAFDPVKSEISIGNEIYKYTDKTMFFSEEHPVEMMDLNATDLLDFQGVDNTIVSVSVKKGHGYLRLKNDANFVGGWIEIGQSQIRKISEDMLLAVAGGNYEVNISHNGGGGVKKVTIRRNEETVLDIGDLEIPKPQEGLVIFSLNPSSAELYIDGMKADASAPITMQYGIHQLIVKAEGYKSVTQYINVNRESVGVDVVLDNADGTEDEDDKKDEDKEEDSLKDYYKVYIDAPDKAEVYVDGNYVGISPCFFRKTEGTHVVTLRRSGYETRSYTIQVDENKKDITYSFVDLVPMEGTNTAAETKASSDSTKTSDNKSTTDSLSTTESKASTESGTGSENKATTESGTGSENKTTTESQASSESQATAELKSADSKEASENKGTANSILEPDRKTEEESKSSVESKTTGGDADTDQNSSEVAHLTDGRAAAEK